MNLKSANNIGVDRCLRRDGAKVELGADEQEESVSCRRDGRVRLDHI